MGSCFKTHSPKNSRERFPNTPKNPKNPKNIPNTPQQKSQNILPTKSLPPFKKKHPLKKEKTDLNKNISPLNKSASNMIFPDSQFDARRWWTRFPTFCQVQWLPGRPGGAYPVVCGAEMNVESFWESC